MLLPISNVKIKDLTPCLLATSPNTRAISFVPRYSLYKVKNKDLTPIFSLYQILSAVSILLSHDHFILLHAPGGYYLLVSSINFRGDSILN